MYKKAQVGPRELLMTLIVAGLLAIVGVLIFSNVANTTEDIFTADRYRISNESITISCEADGCGDNSTLLAKKGFITSSDSVINGTNKSVVLNRNADYKITMVGASSGDLNVYANFTMINMTGDGYNNTLVLISYDYDSESAAQATQESLQDTVLDSFQLGVIALIVLAAVVILGALFMLGKT